MKLHQVDAISLESLQGFIDLFGGGIFCAAIDLGHEENLVSVAIAQRFAHADFTAAIMIIPAIIEEGNSAIYRSVNDTDAFVLRRHANVVTAQADGRNLFAGP